MELTTTSEVAVDHPSIRGVATLVHRRRFAVGVDLGQAHDYTAVCIASRIDTETLSAQYRAVLPKVAPRVEVVHLERLPLGMAYPQQVDHIERLLQRQPLVNLKPSLLIDMGGVGRPVFDMFQQRSALRSAQGVVITGGRETNQTAAGWTVPKGTLVSSLQALLHAGELRISSSLPDAAVLARELQDFRVRFTEAGNATFNGREGAHDDLVLALALAVFGLSRSPTASTIRTSWPR